MFEKEWKIFIFYNFYWLKSDDPQQCMKNLKSALEKKIIFQGKELFFKKFDSIKGVKMPLRIVTKTYADFRISYVDSYEIDFQVGRPPRDQPPAWE